MNIDFNIKVDTSYDNTSLDAQFALAGISDSANFIGFYENDWMAFRLAYNWRDQFLAGTGQTNVGAIPPTYVDEYGQWDASLQFTFMENLNLFVDAINITDETRYVFGRSEGQPLFVQQSGPRFNIGARYTF